MKQDDVLSKRLAEVEERKNRFLARRVEASDQTRVEERHAEEQGSVEPVELLASGQCSAGEDKNVTGRGRVADSSVKPVGLLASGQCSAGGEGEAIDKICSWIECSHDKRSWAEATEDQNRALPFTPVPARVEEAGPEVLPSPVGSHGDGRMKKQQRSVDQDWWRFLTLPWVPHHPSVATLKKFLQVRQAQGE